jgi:tetratricopeptide (TPR) repeat protein
MTWDENQTSGEKAFEEGRYAEAARFFTAAIQAAESLADDQVKLADSLYYLGKVYTLFEDFPKAESALTKALAIRGKALGTENAQIAEVIEQLGTLYLNERKYEQSEPMLKRALDMRLKLFGEESAEAAGSMAALGALNTSRNLLRDAEALLRKALNIQEHKLGPNNKELAATLGLLALCRMRRKDYTGAENLARRALEIRSQAHGMEHPNVAMTLHILASTCMAQGKFDQAASFYESALRIRERFLTVNHSGIVSILRVLGYTYIQKHDYEHAEEVFRRLETLSFGQPQYVKEWCDAVRFLAQTYVITKHYEEGEHYIYRALDQFEQAEIDNEDCRSALIKSLVRCHLGQKKFVDAAREVPTIASMTFSKALKKLENTQSVATIRELMGGLKRRSSTTVESDN